MAVLALLGATGAAAAQPTGPSSAAQRVLVAAATAQIGRSAALPAGAVAVAAPAPAAASAPEQRVPGPLAPEPLAREQLAREQLARKQSAQEQSVHASGTAPTEAFDAAFDEAFRRYQLPGMAAGVLLDGKVAWRRTAGELVAGGGQPVTSASLFKIASNTKAMTTAVLARLVDAGKLRWEDPVRLHLPQLRMHDAWVGEHLQVRDLLIHNSGLRMGAGDLMLWPEPNAFTRADVIGALAHLVPTGSFRAEYAYDNILYIVAGEVAAAAGGASYEELVRSELFEPLRLQRCRVGGFNRDAVGDVAQAHMRVDGRNVLIRADPVRVEPITSAAAGGIRCSLDDMLAWARNWLDPGSEGLRWLSAAQRRAVWSAHMPMPLEQRQRDWDRGHFNAYGYGWRLSDTHGQFRVAHTGTLGGMYSALVLLPDLRAGFVLLINGEAGEARTVLSQVLTQQLLAADPAERQAHSVARYAALLAAGRAQAEPDATAVPPASARRAVAPDALRDRLGTWTDPWFGSVSLCAQGDRIRFTAHKSPALAGTLQRVGDRLLVDWDQQRVDAEPWLHFEGDGEQATLALSHVDPQADFSYDYEDLAFRRTGACAPPSATKR